MKIPQKTAKGMAIGGMIGFVAGYGYQPAGEKEDDSKAN